MLPSNLLTKNLALVTSKVHDLKQYIIEQDTPEAH